MYQCLETRDSSTTLLQGGAEDLGDDKRCQLLYEKQTLLKEPVQGNGIGALVRLRVSGLLSADTCCKDFF